MDEKESKKEEEENERNVSAEYPDTEEEESNCDDGGEDYQESEEGASQTDLVVTLQQSKSLQYLETLDDSIPNAALENMEKLLKLLAKDSTEEGLKHLELLSSEYDKIKALMIDSRQQTRTVAKRATGMSTELAENALKVQGILKTSQSDRSQLAIMKKEIKKAWKVVEANKDRDAKAKELISSLKNEVAALRSGEINILPTGINSASSAGGGMGKNKLLSLQIEQDEQLKKLTKAKADLEVDLARNQSEIKSIRADLEERGAKLESVNKERSYVEEEMVALKEYLAAKKAEHDREVRAREKVELNLRQTNEQLERRDIELRSKTDEIKSLKEALNKAETILLSEKARSEKMTAERDLIYAQQTRLQQEFEEKDSTNETLLNSNHEQARKLKAWDEEISRLRETHKGIAKAKLALAKKIKVLDEEKMTSDMERDGLRSTNAHLVHDLETTKKELEQATKNIDMITRERDISQKNFVKSTGASLKQYNSLKLSEQNKRNLEQEIAGYKDEAQKMRKLIFTLEKERDHRLNAMTSLNEEITTRDEELKMQNAIIFDSKKKIADCEKKLKEQQSLYENVRTDRNVYSKNLLESQDEIMEMKRKLKIMNHQVEQLKEEIASRETVLVKEHFEHSKLEKEKESLLLQIGKIQQQYDESHQMIQNQASEESKLRHIIAEADMERIRQKKEYEAVVQERDILGTHLIRRNDELSLLYEKIKIQTSTLNKGEIQYRERLEDIRVLRLEIKKLRREKAMLQTETQNIENLRNEVFRLQRDILRERTRVKVLEEELESPMNIHRWRKLAGSDPSTFELISKIQMLQKRLIVKTEEVVEKELVIQQKEKLYVDVKKVLQRQPGPEIMEELQTVRAAVKSKVRESKALASELNMYHSQVNEYKYEIDRVNREMQDLKSKYYQLRKKNQSEKKNNQDLIPEPDMYPLFDARAPFDITEELQSKTASRSTTAIKAIKPNLVSGPRFSGGGFNMSATGQQSALSLKDQPPSPETVPDLPIVPLMTPGEQVQ